MTFQLRPILAIAKAVDLPSVGLETDAAPTTLKPYDFATHVEHLRKSETPLRFAISQTLAS